MSELSEDPRVPLIQTMPMPKDLNGNGDVFGGWVLSEMDIAAGILASRTCGGRCATVAIEAMTFLKPISVGDLVTIYGEVAKRGRTSVHVRLDTWVIRQSNGTREQVTEGTFIFVAIDEEGRPRPLPAVA